MTAEAISGSSARTNASTRLFSATRRKIFRRKRVNRPRTLCADKIIFISRSSGIGSERLGFGSAPANGMSATNGKGRSDATRLSGQRKSAPSRLPARLAPARIGLEAVAVVAVAVDYSHLVVFESP